LFKLKTNRLRFVVQGLGSDTINRGVEWFFMEKAVKPFVELIR